MLPVGLDDVLRGKHFLIEGDDSLLDETASDLVDRGNKEAEWRQLIELDLQDSVIGMAYRSNDTKIVVGPNVYHPKLIQQVQPREVLASGGDEQPSLLIAVHVEVNDRPKGTSGLFRDDVQELQ